MSCIGLNTDIEYHGKWWKHPERTPESFLICDHCRELLPEEQREILIEFTLQPLQLAICCSYLLSNTITSGNAINISFWNTDESKSYQITDNVVITNDPECIVKVEINGFTFNRSEDESVQNLAHTTDESIISINSFETPFKCYKFKCSNNSDDFEILSQSGRSIYFTKNGSFEEQIPHGEYTCVIEEMMIHPVDIYNRHFLGEYDISLTHLGDAIVKRKVQESDACCLICDSPYNSRDSKLKKIECTFGHIQTHTIRFTISE